MATRTETYEVRLLVSGCTVPVGMDPRSYAAGVAAGALTEATRTVGTAVPVHDLEVSQRYQDWIVSAKTTRCL